MPFTAIGQTIVQARGAYLGTASGASVPSATGKTPGDYYVITTAGGSYAVGDLAIVNAAASGYDKLTPGTVSVAGGGTGSTTAAGARAALDVPRSSEVRIRPVGSGMGFNAYTAGKVQNAFSTGQAIGTDPFTIWLKFTVPSALATTRGIAGIGPDASYHLGSGGNAACIGVISSASDVCFVMGDGTNYTRYPLSLTTSTSTVVDVVITRSGSTIAGYVNGVAVTMTGANTGTGCTVAASITATYATLAGQMLAASTATADAPIYRFVVFNRALSQADVTSLLSVGVDMADIGPASNTAIIGPSTLNGGFETAGSGGADVFGSWTEITGTGGSFVRETTGVYAGSAAAHFVAGSSGSTTYLYQNVGLAYGKRYRVTYAAKSTVGSPTVWMRIGAGNSNGTNTLAMTGSWATYSFEEVNTGTAPSYFYIYAPVASTEFWVDDVTVQRIGVVMDYDFSTGVGLQVPDNAGNNITLDATAGAVEWLQPIRSGHVCIVRSLAYSDISGTSGTTKILDLPPNCGIMRVEFDRTTAFDSSATLNIGTAGSAAKFVSAQSVTSTGIVVASSLDTASQSNSTTTSIYVQKTGTPTVGAVRIRISFEIRG